MNDRNVTRHEDAHRDPISGAPAAHPIGAGVGGATAVAAVGTVVGPVVTVVAAAMGAAVGGRNGKGVGEAIDPTREAAYWRDHYRHCLYVEQGSIYSDYGPAYAFGVDAFCRNPGRTFEELERAMSRQWTVDGGASTLRWDRARPAVRDAWNRVSASV